VVPGITDSPEQLDALVAAIKHAGGRYIYANPLFLKPCSAAIFLPFLEKHFPELVESYRKRYDGKAFLDAAYRKHISQLMARLRRKHGIVQDVESRMDVRSVVPQPATHQLALF
jgi:DNA repair photolyase